MYVLFSKGQIEIAITYLKRINTRSSSLEPLNLGSSKTINYSRIVDGKKNSSYTM